MEKKVSVKNTCLTEQDFVNFITDISERKLKNTKKKLVVLMVDEKDGVLKDMTQTAQFPRIIDKFLKKEK